jgi:hypothetical protein
MATITLGKQWSDAEAVNYTDMNGNFTTIYTLVNGNIDNDNIKSGAAISASKISFGTTVWNRGVLSLATSDISVGTGKDEFTIPQTIPSGKWVVESVEVEVDTAPTSGKTLTIDLNKAGTTMLSAPISVADSAIISTGNTPSVTALSAGDRITIDIDTATSGIASTRVRVNVIIKQYIQS